MDKLDVTLAAIIILLLIWATYAVISTAYAARIIIIPVEEVQEQPFVCPCATKLGYLQAHLDCHEAEDRQK